MSNIDNMRRQLRTMGATFDWESEVVTADPDYYRWNQWFFLQFLKAGLAYRQTSAVDWCPNDGTLAREQVEGADRHCWRCGAKVEKRDLAQWYLKVTNYADELIDFSGLEWPEAIKAQQTNWVGRSEGAELVFTIAPDDHQPGGDELRVFTTRPDTLFGATFMVLAPEHPLVATLTSPERRAEVDAYVARTQTETEIERLSTDREKTGVAIGADAINPINGERIPIWIADYVLAGYGTGAIMAVPAHDERDFAFARAFGLPIRQVVAPPGADAGSELDDAYVAHAADEVLVNSGPYDGMPADEGGRAIVAKLAEDGQGQADGHVSAPRLVDQSPALLGDADPGHLLRARRDRAGPGGGAAGPPAGHRRLPRQRREPAGSRRGVPQRHLSEVRRARPSRDRHDGHVHRLVVVLVSLPVTREERARRSTAPSSTGGRRSRQYTGGAEHAVMHLLYAREFTKMMRDIGLVDQDEPFIRLFNQGQILGLDGERMSKSRGNTVDPDDLVARYGADTVRLFLMFMGPWDQGGPWSPTGIGGIHRFLNRLWTVALDPHGREGGDPQSGELPRRRNGVGRADGRSARRPIARSAT